MIIQNRNSVTQLVRFNDATCYGNVGFVASRCEAPAAVVLVITGE